MAQQVILYSTGCPRCNVLKAKLKAKNICYTENNSVDEMEALGICTVPILSVDGSLLDFSKANEWANQQ